MKNSVLKFVSIFFFVFVLFGCNNSIEQEFEKNTTSISVRLDSSGARNAISPNYVDGIVRIVLKGKLSGSDEKELRKWETTEEGGYTTYACRALTQNPVINDIEVGEWTFTLNCYNADGAEICSATETATLSADVASIVRFKLENTSGEGSVEIGLSIYLSLQDTLARNYMGEVHRIANGDTSITEPQSYGYSIKACLKNLEGTVEKKSDILPLEITDNPSCSVYYAEEEIPSGSYIVSFMVYEKKEDAEEVLLTTVSELVNVAPGINTTTGNNMLTLASLNKSYKINYYYVDKNGDTQPFNEDWWVSKETIPRTFTEYDKIKLPEEKDILRDAYVDPNGGYKGYLFAGWYDEPTLEAYGKSPVDKITSQSSDKNLYAKFLPLSIFVSDLDEVSLDEFYLGLKDPTEFEAYFIVDDFPGEKIPDSWYDKIVWSSSDDTVLQVYDEQNISENANLGKCFTLKAKALKPAPADGVFLVAKIGDKVIAKAQCEISTTINADVANALVSKMVAGETTFTIPDVYTAVGDSSFFGNTKLTSVTIPNTVISIGKSAFASCTGLESIVIPASVQSVGFAAFQGCSSLTSITFNGSTPPEFGALPFDTDNVTYTIYVPYEAIEAYKADLKTYGYLDKVQAKP